MRLSVLAQRFSGAHVDRSMLMFVIQITCLHASQSVSMHHNLQNCRCAAIVLLQANTWEVHTLRKVLIAQYRC